MKRNLLNFQFVETVNKYNVTVDNLDDSIQELLYCALYCDYVSKCELIIVEILDEDKDLVECITNGKYFAKIQKAIMRYKNEV